MTNTSPEPTRKVRVDALRRDVWARASLDENAVEEYADAMRTAQAKFPPVVVFDERGTLWLADGHHRVEAARRAGRKVIRAKIHAGGRREALLHACGANAAYGVRRTNADKRLAVTLMLRDKEWRDWAGRVIARCCAVDEGLVRKVRDELSADGASRAQGVPGRHCVQSALRLRPKAHGRTGSRD